MLACNFRDALEQNIIHQLGNQSVVGEEENFFAMRTSENFFHELTRLASR